MVSRTRGHVDVVREGFIARFDGDPAIVARVKEIQRRHWARDHAAWIVAPHWPSVRRLLHIASELGWEITTAAREAEQRIKSESESLEYSVDVVHDNHGQAWFVCKVGDDDLLLERVKAIPGAYYEDAWWIPTDWDACCGPLIEIVQSDMRLEVSDAAWRLLEEPDVTDSFVRSSVSLQALQPDDDVLELDTAPEELEPDADWQEPAPVERKPRVTARSKQPAPARAEKETG
jgi:hypothetical protein